MRSFNTPNNSLDLFAEQKLSALEAKNQRRYLVETARGNGMSLTVSERALISFTDNDYLGLSTHPDVKKAAAAAAETYGVGAGASRLVTGNHPVYAALEAKIAEIKGTEDAVVFGSGYLANVGIIPTFIGAKDLIIADELVHTCIHAGMALSNAKILFFRHNDVAHAEELLAEHRDNHPHAMIIVDGVYSMDGDLAPLDKLAELAEKYDAWLMNDDAHALGTVGGGRGSAHEFGVEGKVPFQMGTLSKAAGSYGGYLAASKSVIDLIKTRSRSFIYTTALPPAVTAASLKALEIMMAEPERCARTLSHAKRFSAALGLKEPATPIVPLVIGSEKAALDASAALTSQGIKVIAFRPPTVPEGTSRLRFCFSATHKDEDVTHLITVCQKLGLKGKV